MKKEELITALHEVRSGLKSDPIVQSYFKAWNAGVSNDQADFAKNVMARLVEGTGNFQRFTPPAREVCTILKISSFYEAETNSGILHHIAQAKGQFPGPSQEGKMYQDKYLSNPQTFFFVEAHNRVVTTSDLLDGMLHAERPAGELLLEGISAEGGPSLDRVQDVLATVSELITAYCESQGQTEKPRIEISYLDLGSNYQIGVKVDGKAEVGINLSRLLTEMFRCVMNPLAYIRERRADGMTKEITVLADLQKRVDAGELTVEAAGLFAERLLGCGQKLASKRVFPASLLRERTETSPTELLKLIDETTPPLALPAPEFVPMPEGTLPEDDELHLPETT